MKGRIIDKIDANLTYNSYSAINFDSLKIKDMGEKNFAT